MSEQRGVWVEPEVNYVDPERRFCAFCGRPIARRYWEAAAAGGEIATFCSPEHAAREATYPAKPGAAGASGSAWVPERGQA